MWTTAVILVIKNAKITALQVFFLLMLSRLVKIFLYTTSGYEISNFLTEFLGITIGCVIQLLLMIPILILNRKHPGINLISYSMQKFGKFGILVALLFYLFVLLGACGTVCQMSSFMANTIYPVNAIFYVVSLLIAVGYIAYMGVEAIARTSFILSILCLIGVLLIGVGLGKDFEWLNISFALDPSSNLIKEVLEYVSQSNEIVVLILLLPYIEKGAGKLTLSFVSVNAFLTIAAFLMMHGMLGSYALQLQYPVYTAIASTDIFSFKRFDTIQACLIVISCVIKCALFLFAAVETAQTCAIKTRQERKLFFISLAAIAAFALMIVGKIELLKDLNKYGGNFIALVLLAFVIPLLALLIGRTKKYEKKLQ